MSVAPPSAGRQLIEGSSPSASKLGSPCDALTRMGSIHWVTVLIFFPLYR